MKPITKVLITIFILSGLMPLIAGSMCLFAAGKAAQVFHLTAITPDVQVLLIILGVSLLSFAAIYMTGAALLMKRKMAGITIVLLTGWFTTGSGALIAILFKSHAIGDFGLGIADVIKGAVILAIGLAAKRKENFS